MVNSLTEKTARGDERHAMQTNDNHVHAWRTFVSTGTIPKGMVRPEIARSWQRCRTVGLNPWSTDYPGRNQAMLAERTKLYSHSIHATAPVMRFLMALLGCNVSLMDGENFVFALLSPLENYPRTLGTFVREDLVGTNAFTIAAHELKTIRCEGFELYRAVAQQSSGVSSPYLNERGKYYGAMGLNSPFGSLPDEAERIAEEAVRLTKKLFWMRWGMPQGLDIIPLLQPLLHLYEQPSLVTDMQGRILAANAPMREFCPRWDESVPGSSKKTIGDYLADDQPLGDLMVGTNPERGPKPVSFLQRRGAKKVIDLLRCTSVDTEIEPYLLFVFDGSSPAGKSHQARQRFRSSSAMPQAESNRRRSRTIDYIGESPEWLAVDEMVSRVAPMNASVLLMGETGVGKEVVARAIHRRSGRPGKFVAINCGAIPHDLFASELFGYEAGAFTGARERGAMGKVEYADDGTLFLDEIGEMSFDLQVSILRVLQERSILALGSNEERRVDVRFIAATNRDLRELVHEKRFRQDLFYRLNAMEITLPPLRYRKSDIPLLANWFNRQVSEELELDYVPFSKDMMASLAAYSWPGNVREVRNVVERCLIFAGDGGKASAKHLPSHIANASNGAPLFLSDPYGESPAPDAASTEAQGYDSLPDEQKAVFPVQDGEGANLPDRRAFGWTDDAPAPAFAGDAPADDAAGARGCLSEDRVVELLERHQGNVSAAAREANVPRSTFKRRVEALGLRIRVVRPGE